LRETSPSSVSQNLLLELKQLPSALQEVSQRLHGHENQTLLEQIMPGNRLLLIYDDEMELVSRYGARVFREQGIDAQTVNLVEIEKWPVSLRERYDRVLFLGSEFPEEFSERFAAGRFLWLSGSITKNKSQRYPLIPFEGQWSGSLSFISLGLFLWGVSHQLNGASDADTLKMLKKLRQRVGLQIDGLEYLTEEWGKLLTGCSHLQMIGVDFNQIAAQFAVQKMQSWLGANIGQYSVGEIPLIPASACIVMGSLRVEWIPHLQMDKRVCVLVPEGFPVQSSGGDFPISSFPDSLTVILNVICGEIIALALSNKNNSF
jgi:hypothetical protein